MITFKTSISVSIASSFLALSLAGAESVKNGNFENGGVANLTLRKSARLACDSGKARNYLNSPDPEVRRYALFRLTEKNPEKALDTLENAVKDKSPLVRITAVYALSRISAKNPLAAKMLESLTNDPNLNVRNAANRFSWPFQQKNIRLSEDPSWDYTVTTLKSIKIPDDSWKMTTDSRNKGHQINYYKEKINDSAWSTVKYGYWSGNMANYTGYVWYRIRFTMPPKIKCNAVEVRFTGVDESAWVWLNGEYLGAHDIGVMGYDKTFSLDCRKEIRFGKENLLVVRVLNREQAGGIWKPIFIDILK